MARGPGLAATAHDRAVDAWIWERKSAPGSLWLGVGALSPPRLFLRAEDPEQLAALLERFFLHPRPPAERPRTYELLVGILPEMRDIEDMFVTNSFTHPAPLRLGTAATDEHPFPEDVERETMLHTTFSTRHTDSLIDLYGWHGSMIGVRDRVVTGRVSYAPAPDTELIRAYNAERGTNHPEDLPIDCVGALDGYPNVTLGRLESEVEIQPKKLILMTLVLAHDRPRALATLQPWLEHPNDAVARDARGLRDWLSGKPPAKREKRSPRGKRKPR